MKNTMKKLLSLLLVVVMMAGIGVLPSVTIPANAATITSYAKGDIIEFGWYPQSRVTDSATVSALNAADGEWISYNYYSGTGDWDDGQMTASDYMRYKDVLYNGNKYRGVVFDSYRPYCAGYTSSPSYSWQDNNGYYTNTVYWFKYEPIRWYVQEPATGRVLSETVLDSQAYNNYILCSGTDEYGQIAYWGDAGKTYYANNYEKSSIRQWLNDDFYNTAFSSAQQNIIASTTLDNSANTNRMAYGSASTSDKIYILSIRDSINVDYGFSSSDSDYAKCQGLRKDTGKGWLLRTVQDSSVECLEIKKKPATSMPSAPIMSTTPTTVCVLL